MRQRNLQVGISLHSRTEFHRFSAFLQFHGVVPDAGFIELRTIRFEALLLIEWNGVQLGVHHDFIGQWQIGQYGLYKSGANTPAPEVFFDRKTLEFDNPLILESPSGCPGRIAVNISDEMRAFVVIVIILLRWVYCLFHDKHPSPDLERLGLFLLAAYFSDYYHAFLIFLIKNGQLDNHFLFLR